MLLIDSTPPARTAPAAPVCTIIAAVDHRLQPAAAAPVDLQPGHRDRQAGVQRGPPPDAGCLGVGVGLRHHDVLDPSGVDARPVHDGADDRRGQVLGRDRAQGTAEPAHRGADGGDDGGPGHPSALFMTCSSSFAARAAR